MMLSYQMCSFFGKGTKQYQSKVRWFKFSHLGVRHDHDRMLIRFTTTYALITYHPI
jgi:hypothetical protein